MYYSPERPTFLKNPRLDYGDVEWITKQRGQNMVTVKNGIYSKGELVHVEIDINGAECGDGSL